VQFICCSFLHSIYCPNFSGFQNQFLSFHDNSDLFLSGHGNIQIVTCPSSLTDPWIIQYFMVNKTQAIQYASFIGTLSTCMFINQPLTVSQPTICIVLCQSYIDDGNPPIQFVHYHVCQLKPTILCLKCTLYTQLCVFVDLFICSYYSEISFSSRCLFCLSPSTGLYCILLQYRYFKLCKLLPVTVCN